jgi:hypothetical protein
MAIVRILILIGGALLLVAGCGGGGGGGGDDDGVCGAVVDISENAMLNGRLEEGDCTINDIFPGAGDPSFADEFRVTLPVGGTLQITLRSTEFDAFLAILDTSNSCSGGCNPAIVLAADDDSGGGFTGFDSLISIDLAAGTYIILANSITAASGNYSLETQF